jgi:hypothetical protein
VIAGERWGRTFIVVVLGILVAVFYVTAAGHFSYTTDDSYIYFQYARNLSDGNGPSFNAGEPSYGFTSPLWMLILSAGGAAGADIPLLGKILDLIFAALSIVLFFFVAYELVRDVAVAFCATLAFSVNAWLLRWAGTGLETSLAVFLVLAFFRYLLRNEYTVAAGVLGLLALVRPEASILLGVLLLDLGVNSLDRGQALREGTRAVSVWLVIVLPWTAYAYAKFGTILPTTFGAKSGAFLRPAEMAGAAEDILRTLGSADGAMLAILFISLALYLVGRRKFRKSRPDEPLVPFYAFRQGLAAMLWLVLLPAAYTIGAVNTVSRYLLPATVPAIAMAFFWLHELVRERSAALRYGVVLGATALVMLQNQAVTSRYVNPHVVTFTEGVASCLVPIGEWLKANTPPGTIIMTGDVGVIGYVSGRTICDFNGIVTPGVPAGKKDNDAFTELLRARGWGEYCAPAYVLHRSGVPEELATVPGLVPLLSRPFPGLSITDNSTVYFTLYRVEYPAPEKLLTQR